MRTTLGAIAACAVAFTVSVAGLAPATAAPTPQPSESPSASATTTAAPSPAPSVLEQLAETLEELPECVVVPPPAAGTGASPANSANGTGAPAATSEPEPSSPTEPTAAEPTAAEPTPTEPTPTGPTPADPSTTPEPTASADQEPAPGLSCEDLRARLAESTQAVIDGVGALQQAQTELAGARAKFAKAQAALDAAVKAQETAEADLRRAVVEEGVTARRIDELSAEQARTREDVGSVAAAAYRSGPFHSASVVLDATDPADFTDRLDQYASALRNNESTLAGMAELAAALRNAQAQLLAQRVESARLADLAAANVARREQAGRAAKSAAAEVGQRVADQRSALQGLEATRRGDLAAYQRAQAESEAVAERLAELAELDVLSGDAGELPELEGFTIVRPGTGSVSSPFGQRRHPILGYVKLHTGTDMGVGDGLIRAAADGRVRIAESNTAYGLMTVIEHGTVDGRSLSTLYAHQAEFRVRPGDVVQAGQVIGVVGSTGYSTGPHLHFEVRIDGDPVDPAPYLAAAG